MAVYTKISKDELLKFFSQYNLGKIISYKGIKEGIENTNYLIQTDKKKLFLQFMKKELNQKIFLFL